jgi:hypothetical protein
VLALTSAHAGGVFVARRLRCSQKLRSCVSMEIERAERNFNAERGFGFIGPDDSGKDVFVHLCGMSGRGRWSDRLAGKTQVDPMADIQIDAARAERIIAQILRDEEDCCLKMQTLWQQIFAAGFQARWPRQPTNLRKAIE